MEEYLTKSLESFSHKREKQVFTGRERTEKSETDYKGRLITLTQD